MSPRLVLLAATLAAAVTAPFVVSAAGAPNPAVKDAPTVAVASVNAPAPKPVQAPATIAAAPSGESAVNCGRRVRVVYPGYAAPTAPAACTASR